MTESITTVQSNSTDNLSRKQNATPVARVSKIGPPPIFVSLVRDRSTNSTRVFDSRTTPGYKEVLLRVVCHTQPLPFSVEGRKVHAADLVFEGPELGGTIDGKTLAPFAARLGQLRQDVSTLISKVQEYHSAKEAADGQWTQKAIESALGFFESTIRKGYSLKLANSQLPYSAPATPCKGWVMPASDEVGASSSSDWQLDDA
jgi:hypothetical protein